MAETAADRNSTDTAAPARASAPPGTSALDRPVVGNLSLEKCLYILVFAVALLTRLYVLGDRPYHHDESIHAFFSWKITQAGLGDYQYDPVYHGPLLYYWTALVLKVFGDSDFTARLSPVSFGLALLAFAWPLRRYLGRWGALSFLVLTTFSPSMSYFTRFLRHDIYVALCNLAAVYFGFRYAEERKAWHLYVVGAALSLAFCTKEDMYALLPVFGLSVILMLLWEVVHAADWRRALRGVTGETWDLCKVAVLPLITTLVIFTIIWLVFYTSFGTHPKNWNSVNRALSYWMGQHEIKRIGGPWWYYFPDLTVYEPLVFFPALLYLLGPLLQAGSREPTSTRVLAYATWITFAAFVGSLFVAATQAPLVLLASLTFAGLTLMRRWLPDRFTRFVIIWAMGCFGFYSWAQEKVPWLMVPVMLPMLLVAAMWYRQVIETRVITRPATALVLAAGSLFTIWTLIASNYLYDAPHPEEGGGKNDTSVTRHGELMAYVQSTYDVTKVVVKRIEAIAAAMNTGTQTRLAVSGNATWPLSWYLRKYPVNWAADVRSVDQPVVVIDPEAAVALDKALGDKYDKVKFQIRGWWEPDYRSMDPAKLVRYLFTREVWNGVGSSDAVMYALKDPKPGTTVAAIAVNPPPAARGYQQPPILLKPASVFGEKGSGPGQFNEPRGLAVDGNGNIFVVDSKNDRVQKLAADGHPVTTWGHEGNDPGNFKDPCGIAVGSDGFVYVADTWNHRVQKFDNDGKFVVEWKEQTSGFWGPRGIAVAPDNSAVYVTDTGNKRVVSFDTSGKQNTTWGHDGSKQGELIEPVGITVDKENHVWVADTGNHRVQIFDNQGKYIKEYQLNGWEEFYSEPYMAMLGTDLVVTDSFNHRCARYTDGQLDYSWGKSGSDSGDFNRPIGIATDSKGAVYVSDTLNHRIQKFDLPPPTKK